MAPRPRCRLAGGRHVLVSVVVVALLALAVVNVARALSPRRRLDAQAASASAAALEFEHVCGNLFRVFNRSPSAQTFELSASAGAFTPADRRDTDTPSATTQRLRRFVVPAATVLLDEATATTTLTPSSIYAALEQRHARPIAVEFTSGAVHRLVVPPTGARDVSDCVRVSFRCRGVLEVANHGVGYPLPLRITVREGAARDDFVLSGVNSLPAAQSPTDLAVSLLRFDEAVYFSDRSDAMRIDVALLPDDSVSVDAASSELQPLLMLKRNLRSPSRERCSRSLASVDQLPSDEVLQSLTCGARALFSIVRDQTAFLARLASATIPPAQADRECDSNDDGVVDTLVEITPDEAQCKPALEATTPQRACCAGNLLLDQLLTSDSSVNNDPFALIADIRVIGATRLLVDTSEADVGLSYVALYNRPLNELIAQFESGDAATFIDERTDYRFLNCPLSPTGQTARGEPTEFAIDASTEFISVCSFRSVDDTFPSTCAAYPSSVARWTFGSGVASDQSLDTHLAVAPYDTVHTLGGSATPVVASQDSFGFRHKGVAGAPHRLFASASGHTTFELDRGTIMGWFRSAPIDGTAKAQVLFDRRLPEASGDGSPATHAGVTVSLRADGTIEVRTYSAVSSSTLSSSTRSGLDDNIWHHVAFTWDTRLTARSGRAGELHLFVDGALETIVGDDVAASLAWASAAAWRLGWQERSDAAALLDSFAGELEDVRLFGEAVIPGVPRAIFVNSPKVLTPGSTEQPQEAFNEDDLEDENVRLVLIAGEEESNDVSELVRILRQPPTTFYLVVTNAVDSLLIELLEDAETPSDGVIAKRNNRSNRCRGRRANSKPKCRSDGESNEDGSTSTASGADSTESCGAGGCNTLVNVEVNGETVTVDEYPSTGTRTRRRKRQDVGDDDDDDELLSIACADEIASGFSIDDIDQSTDVCSTSIARFEGAATTKKRKRTTGCTTEVVTVTTRGGGSSTVIVETCSGGAMSSTNAGDTCGSGGCNTVGAEQEAQTTSDDEAQVCHRGRRRRRRRSDKRDDEPEPDMLYSNSLIDERDDALNVCPLADDIEPDETLVYILRGVDALGQWTDYAYIRENAWNASLGAQPRNSGTAVAYVDTYTCEVLVDIFDLDTLPNQELPRTVPALQGTYGSGAPRRIQAVALQAIGFAVLAEMPSTTHAASDPSTDGYELVLVRLSDTGVPYSADVLVSRCAKTSTMAVEADFLVVAYQRCDATAGSASRYRSKKFRIDVDIDVPPNEELCGNGEIDSGEECDPLDGLSNTTADACRPGCVNATCGDGVVDSNEECDDGADDNAAPESTCRPTSCKVKICGDGIIDSLAGVFTERCDAGVANGGSGPHDCRVDCTFCGDGIVDSGVEDCDDGLSGSPTCSSTCVRIAACGDGSVDAGEECDDGNNDDDDGCSSTCRDEKFLRHFPMNTFVVDEDGEVSIDDVRSDVLTNLLPVSAQVTSGGIMDPGFSESVTISGERRRKRSVPLGGWALPDLEVVRAGELGGLQFDSENGAYAFFNDSAMVFDRATDDGFSVCSFVRLSNYRGLVSTVFEADPALTFPFVSVVELGSGVFPFPIDAGFTMRFDRLNRQSAVGFEKWGLSTPVNSTERYNIPRLRERYLFDSWNHVCVVNEYVDASNDRVRVYWNGDLMRSYAGRPVYHPVTPSEEDTVDVTFGVDSFLNVLTSSYKKRDGSAMLSREDWSVQFSMSDLRFYRRRLSTSEVSTIERQFRPSSVSEQPVCTLHYTFSNLGTDAFNDDDTRRVFMEPIASATVSSSRLRLEPGGAVHTLDGVSTFDLGTWRERDEENERVPYKNVDTGFAFFFIFDDLEKTSPSSRDYALFTLTEVITSRVITVQLSFDVAGNTLKFDVLVDGVPKLPATADDTMPSAPTAYAISVDDHMFELWRWSPETQLVPPTRVSRQFFPLSTFAGLPIQEGRYALQIGDTSAADLGINLLIDEVQLIARLLTPEDIFALHARGRSETVSCAAERYGRNDRVSPRRRQVPDSYFACALEWSFDSAARSAWPSTTPDAAMQDDTRSLFSRPINGASIGGGGTTLDVRPGWLVAEARTSLNTINLRSLLYRQWDLSGGSSAGPFAPGVTIRVALAIDASDTLDPNAAGVNAGIFGFSENPERRPYWLAGQTGAIEGVYYQRSPGQWSPCCAIDDTVFLNTPVERSLTTLVITVVYREGNSGTIPVLDVYRNGELMSGMRNTTTLRAFEADTQPDFDNQFTAVTIGLIESEFQETLQHANVNIESAAMWPIAMVPSEVSADYQDVLDGTSCRQEQPAPTTIAGTKSLNTSSPNANGVCMLHWSFEVDEHDNTGLLDSRLVGTANVAGGDLVLTNANQTGPAEAFLYTDEVPDYPEEVSEPTPPPVLLSMEKALARLKFDEARGVAPNVAQPSTDNRTFSVWLQFGTSTTCPLFHKRGDGGTDECVVDEPYPNAYVSMYEQRVMEAYNVESGELVDAEVDGNVDSDGITYQRTHRFQWDVSGTFQHEFLETHLNPVSSALVSTHLVYVQSIGSSTSDPAYTLYVDGEPYARPEFVGSSGGEAKRAAGGDYNLSPSAATVYAIGAQVIDFVEGSGVHGLDANVHAASVYDRALDDQEVRWLFQQGDAYDCLPATPEPTPLPTGGPGTGGPLASVVFAAFPFYWQYQPESTGWSPVDDGLLAEGNDFAFSGFSVMPGDSSGCTPIGDQFGCLCASENADSSPPTCWEPTPERYAIRYATLPPGTMTYDPMANYQGWTLNGTYSAVVPDYVHADVRGGIAAGMDTNSGLVLHAVVQFDDTSYDYVNGQIVHPNGGDPLLDQRAVIASLFAVHNCHTGSGSCSTTANPSIVIPRLEITYGMFARRQWSINADLVDGADAQPLTSRFAYDVPRNNGGALENVTSAPVSIAVHISTPTPAATEVKIYRGIYGVADSTELYASFSIPRRTFLPSGYDEIGLRVGAGHGWQAGQGDWGKVGHAFRGGVLEAGIYDGLTESEIQVLTLEPLGRTQVEFEIPVDGARPGR